MTLVVKQIHTRRRFSLWLLHHMSDGLFYSLPLHDELFDTEKKTSRDTWLLNRLLSLQVSQRNSGYMSLLSTSMHVRPRTWRTLDRQIITYISSMFFLFEWTSLRRESAQTLHYLSWFTSLTQVKFQGRCPSPSRHAPQRNQQKSTVKLKYIPTKWSKTS